MNNISELENSKCVGCKACGDICPVDAIIFGVNDEGFWYPHVDESKCINCGKCKQVCPAINNIDNADRSEAKVFRSSSIYGDVRRKSTSGGVFWEVASAFINDGGVVFGCKWNDDYKSASHVIARNIGQLEFLRGSKYIQSDTAGVFKQVKDEIEQGRKVLFCGTPCQNAALYLYLDRNTDNNIFYVDFICRSINSPRAFKAYIEELEEKYGSKVKLVQLKNKKKGWQSLASYVEFEDGSDSLLDRNEDYWINGFIGKDLYTRDSCHNCGFRALPRKVANLTIGDYWGVQNETNYELFMGVSVVLVNDEKGQLLLDTAKERLSLKEKTIESVLPGNPALLNNPPHNDVNKKKFFEFLNDSSFSGSYIKLYGELQHCSNPSPDEAYEADVEKYRNEGIIDKTKYIYLNFESGNIVHKGRGRIIPFQNTVWDIKESSRIVLESDDDLLVGTNQFKGAHIETQFRMGDNAYWNVRHGGYIFCGITLDIKRNAVFDSGFFSANTGTVIVCARRIVFGEDVMIGRNVIVYDSDFHEIGGKEKSIYGAKDVVIEDHVWLTGNINVNKGVRIGEGSIVANQTVVNKSIPKYSLVAGKSNGEVIRNGTIWNRTSIIPFLGDVHTKQIILFGYGIEGKKFYEQYKDRISFVIDNYDSDEKCCSFSQFVKDNNSIDNQKYLWVIASPNHFDSLFDQIRSKYSDAVIISHYEMIDETRLLDEMV